MHFANIVPPDNDSTFSSHSVRVVEHILRNAEDKFDSKIYKGRIRLLLKGNVIWLDNIVLSHAVKDYEVTVLYLKEKLLKSKVAEYKESALEDLFELCRAVDIPVPKYQIVQNKVEVEERKVKPFYAFLEEDIAYNEVYFRSGNSPSQFFVCLKKYHSL